MANKKNGWIGFDLDMTTAEYHPGDYNKYGASHIGKPIPRTVDRIIRYIQEGYECRILTARLDPNNDEPRETTIRRIQEWCEKHIGYVLPVTDKKDFNMIALFDDRAIGVVPNTGEIIGEEPNL
jgi:hypothetical protein